MDRAVNRSNGGGIADAINWKLLNLIENKLINQGRN